MGRRKSQRRRLHFLEILPPLVTYISLPSKVENSIGGEDISENILSHKILSTSGVKSGQQICRKNFGDSRIRIVTSTMSVTI